MVQDFRVCALVESDSVDDGAVLADAEVKVVVVGGQVRVDEAVGVAVQEEADGHGALEALQRKISPSICHLGAQICGIFFPFLTRYPPRDSLMYCKRNVRSRQISVVSKKDIFTANRPRIPTCVSSCLTSVRCF